MSSYTIKYSNDNITTTVSGSLKITDCSVGSLLWWNCCTIFDKVIYNPPATIVYWNDGTKTIVRCGPNDKFNEESGFAAALLRKVYGDRQKFQKMLEEKSYRQYPVEYCGNAGRMIITGKKGEDDYTHPKTKMLSCACGKNMVCPECAVGIGTNPCDCDGVLKSLENKANDNN